MEEKIESEKYLKPFVKNHVLKVAIPIRFISVIIKIIHVLNLLFY
jgi:hypothetical protein